MKSLQFYLIVFLMGVSCAINMIVTERKSDINKEHIKNYQTTIDSLINKNQRLNDGFLELYDDRAMMSIEMDKLVRDNKYLKRITR